MGLLFKGGDYSRAAAIRGRRLFEGGDYSRAASAQGNAVFTGQEQSFDSLLRMRSAG